MFSILKSSHSLLAYVALLALVICVVMAAVAFFSKKTWSASQFKIALFGLIAAHIQLLLGLLLYFTSPNGMSNLSGETMKDSFGRLLAVEHPFTNIIALIIITLGYSKGKKALESLGAAKTVFIYYGIGLILILSRIPWKVWLQ
jgi:hypothetical protein